MKNESAFLYGYYGCNNVGDDLLLMATISKLKETKKIKHFFVRTYSPIQSLLHDESVEFSSAEHILFDAGAPRLLRIFRYIKHHVSIFRKCSFFVFGGGTIFHARNGAIANLALICCLVFFAKLYRLQVYAIGVGVAPMHTFTSRLIMSLIMLSTEDFVVRDHSSFNNSRSLTSKARLRLAADLVFSLPLSGASPDRKLNQKPLLALTLAASDIENGKGYERFLRELSVSCEQLVHDGWSICFLSFQEFHQENVVLSDTQLFKFAASFVDPLDYFIVRVDADLSSLASLFSTIDVICGMRFHGHVLAALFGIPFVGIGRDDKLRDICKQLSMPFLDIGDVNAPTLATAINGVRGSHPDIERIRQLCSSSAENFCKIGKLW